jgi:hypothetical protein
VNNEHTDEEAAIVVADDVRYIDADGIDVTEETIDRNMAASRAPVEVWDNIDTDIPEPGVVADDCLGIEGPAIPMPEGDADDDEELGA